MHAIEIGTVTFELRRLVCVDEVLQAKNYSMPDCIMTYSIIPLIECPSTLYLSMQVILISLPTQCEVPNTAVSYWKKLLQSHLNEVLEKIEALSSNTEKLQAYILDRKRSLEQFSRFVSHQSF